MSLDLGALVGSVILDTAPFDRAYSRVVRQFSTLGTQAEKAAAGTATLDRGLAGTATSANAASTALGRAQRTTASTAATEDKAAAAATRHAEAVARVTAITNPAVTTTERLQAAQLRQVAAQERVDTLMASGAASTRQLAAANATLISSTRAVTTAQESAVVATSKWRSGLASTAKMALELGVLIGGIEIAKKAIEFVGAGKELTDALNSVQAASHATDGQMKQVRAQVIGLGKDLTVPKATAVDAAEAIDDLVRAGMTLPRAMGSARAALLLAAAANVDTADSARVLGDVLDEFKLSASQATKTASILAGAATSSAGGLMSVFQAFTYVGTRARALGLNVQDIAAAIVDLSKAGINADRAGTGLAMMLQRLSSESPKGQKALDDLGVKAWNAQGRFVGLPKIIDQLHAAQQRMGVGSKQFLKDVSDAFGARAANAVAAFALRGREGYDSVYKRLSSGDVEKAAALMNRGVGAGFRQLGKEATAAGIDIYQKFEPSITSAVMGVGEELPKAVHTAMTVLSGFSGVGHVAAAGLGVIGDAVRVVVDVLHTIGPEIKVVVGLLAGMWLGFKAGEVAVLAVQAIQRVIAALPGVFAATQAKLTGFWTSQAVAATTSATVIESEAALMSGSAEAASVSIVASGDAARVGWAGLAGPLGAAAIGVAVLISMFHKSSSASKQAAAAAKAYTDALGSGGDQTTIVDTIRDQLSKSDVPQKINELNKALGTTAYSGNQFVTAIAGGGPALTKLGAQLESVITKNYALYEAEVKAGRGNSAGAKQAKERADAAQNLLGVLDVQYQTLTKAALQDLVATKAFAGVSSSIQKAAVSTKVGSDTAARYAAMMGIVVDKNGVAAVSAKTLANAVKTVSDAYGSSTETGDAFLAALNSFAQSAGTAADRAALIGATLKAANGDALNYAAQMNAASSANRTFSGDIRQAAKDAKKSTKDYLAGIVDLQTGTIKYRKAGAGPLISDLQQIQSAGLAAAQATYQHARATKSGKDAADEAYKVYVSQTRGQLIDTFTKLTGNAGAARKLADRYLGMPKRVKTLIEQQGANPVVDVLNAIGRQLSYLTGHPWTTKVGAQDNASGTLDAILNRMHTIGQGVNATVNVTTHYQGGGTHTVPMKAGGTGPGGLRDGWAWVGDPGPQSELVRKQGSRVDVFPHRKSVQIAASMGIKVPAYASGTAHPPISTSISGGSGVGTISTDTLGGKKVWIYKGQRYASEMAALNAQQRDRKKDNKEGIVDTATLPGVNGVASVIAGQVGPASRAMRLLSRAVNDAWTLKGIEKSITDVKQKISDMTQYRSGIMDTLRGAFDPTQYGSITDLLTGVSGATATNTAYTAEVNKLRGEAKGDKTLTGFINQLDASGQTATLQMLAKAPKTDLQRVSKAIGGYNASVLAGGNAAVLTNYGTSIAAQQTRERQLEAERRTEVQNIDKLLHAIALITKRPAHIDLKGETIARVVVHPEVIKVLDELGNQLTYKRK